MAALMHEKEQESRGAQEQVQEDTYARGLDNETRSIADIYPS